MTAETALVEAWLTARVWRDGPLLYLDLRSRIDPRQSFLLPVGHAPVIAGMALWTPLGRIHALYWGLAYGRGELPAGSTVRFDADGPCAHRSVVAAVVSLGDGGWVAAAEGVFAAATVVSGDGVDVARTDLSTHW